MSKVLFSVEHHGAKPVVVLVRDGDRIEVPALWLRERSQASTQLDAVTDQRLFDPHRVDPALSIIDVRSDEASLWVRFSDGHDESFALDRLTAAATPDDGCPPMKPWDAGLERPPAHDWHSLSTDDDALFRALHDFIVHGTIVVRDSPTIPGTVLDIAQRFGYVRETNFGRLFDVRTVPDSNDLAYRSIGLGPHTDNPYRMPVPGIQLLHCLVNETSGGLSTLVDAVAVTDRLRDEDAAGFQLLVDTVVRFRFHDAETDLISHRPVVVVDHLGRVTGLNYSPKLDQTPLVTAAQACAYQRARQRLAELLNDPAHQIMFLLQPGEAMMFANDRVLHGRTEFDPSEGNRHLQGCYIDHDAPLSRYRVLSRTREPIAGRASCPASAPKLQADAHLARRPSRDP